MRNQVLDSAKAAAAYSVVLLHIRFPGETGNVINAAARFAVPFFFLISGYFCYRESREAVLKRMPGKVKHILYLAFLALPFYIVWECIQKGIEGESVGDWLKNLLVPHNIEDFVKYNSTTPVKPHLWFLFALLYCYLLFWAVEKLRLHKLAYALIPVLLFCNFWMDGKSGEAGNTYRIMEFRNYLFTGFPFFMLGHFIHREKGRLQKRVPSAVCAVLIAAGAGLSIAEYFILGRRELFAGSVILSVSFFLFAVFQEGKKGPEVLGRIGAKYTFSIYVLHMAVGDIWKDLALLVHGQESNLYLWTRPVMVCILTTLLAAVLNNAKGRIVKFSEK